MRVKVSEDAGVKARTLGMELAAEFFYDDIIAQVKHLCKSYTPTIIQSLIKNDQPPSMLEAYIEKAGEYKDYLRQFPPGRLFEWLNDARPDLARAVMAAGDEGVVWWHKWIEIFKKRARGEGVKSTRPQLSEVACSVCGKGIVINKEDAEDLKVCPFCGAPAF